MCLYSTKATSLGELQCLKVAGNKQTVIGWSYFYIIDDTNFGYEISLLGKSFSWKSMVSAEFKVLSFSCSHILSIFVAPFVLDIDECKNNPCHTDANCTDTDGSFLCHCKPGFYGDGNSCSGKSSPIVPIKQKILTCAEWPLTSWETKCLSNQCPFLEGGTFICPKFSMRGLKFSKWLGRKISGVEV